MATVLTVASAAARKLSRPESDLRSSVLIMALPLLVLVVAIAAELLNTQAATWSIRAIGSQAKVCSVAIFGLSLAPLAVLLTAMRAAAPRSPSVAGAVVGLLAGATGALFYAMHCPDDSPVFVALWYTPPIAAIAATGAIIGNHLLRW